MTTAGTQPGDESGEGMLTFKYAVRGPVAEPVAAEVRRGHDLANQLTEIEHAYEASKAAAWEEDPAVAPHLAAVAAAAEAEESARDAAAAAKQRAGYAVKTGNKARAAAAREEAAQARAVLREARKALAVARAGLRDVKAARWPQAQRAIFAARQERDDAIRGTYSPCAVAGMYWATWNDIVAHHKARVRRVGEARKAGQPAAVRFKRWDGTGTVTVQIQRQDAITRADRDEVTRLRAEGMTPAQIGQVAGRTAMAVAKMKPDGPETAGDPPCTPAVLASGEGKWRNVVRLSGLPDGFADLPRSERRRIARTGEVAVRTGGGDQAAVNVMPVTIHRPMPADGEVTMARLSVTRCGPDLSQHVTFPVRTRFPAAKAAGRDVRVHLGWRILPSGDVRVAVISGAGPVPETLAGTGTVRAHPWGHEVVIPLAWRGGQDVTEKLRSVRDEELGRVREEAAVWLEGHPQPAEPGLPSPAVVRQRRSPGFLAVLGRRARAGEYGDEARELGALIGAWESGDVPAWRREARSRRRLARRRDDVYGQVAAWLCAGARTVTADEWDVASLARKPGTGGEDDPQAAAARAVRVLAAPGMLRSAIVSAGPQRGVVVTAAERGGAVQVHVSCGAVLDAEARRRSVVVRCECGTMVDQDVNMLLLMA